MFFTDVLVGGVLIRAIVCFLWPLFGCPSHSAIISLTSSSPYSSSLATPYFAAFVIVVRHFSCKVYKNVDDDDEQLSQTQLLEVFIYFNGELRRKF